MVYFVDVEFTSECSGERVEKIDRLFEANMTKLRVFGAPYVHYFEKPCMTTKCRHQVIAARKMVLAFPVQTGNEN